MDPSIPARESPLRAYYVASSVQEAIAFLAAHGGQAQVVAGGTVVLPQVLGGRSITCYLVDVSRIGALRRIRIEEGWVLLGGAVTFGQLLRAEAVIEALPILQEMALDAAPSGSGEQSTLAGNVVSAFGDSAVATALIALEAEAEIANLTGSQWLPVRSLLVSPGACRVDSTSEVLVSLRLRLPERGSGAALARMDPQEDTGDASVMAVSVRLDSAPDLISALTLVMGTRGDSPRIARLGELSDGHPPTVDAIRRTAAQWAAAQFIGPAGLPSRMHLAGHLANSVLDVAVDRARTSLASAT